MVLKQSLTDFIIIIMHLLLIELVVILALVIFLSTVVSYGATQSNTNNHIQYY